MKSLQLRVLRNETMNCTKELCIGELKLFQHSYLVFAWGVVCGKVEYAGFASCL
jgi:hypothetical protein